MKTIQKVKISNALMSAGIALTLMVAACSKKENVTPVVNTEGSGVRLSAVSTKPCTVDLDIKGLDNEQHLNRKFQFRRVENFSGGNGGWGGRGDRGWKEDLVELTFDAVQQKFVGTNIYPANRITSITGPFTEGYYIFRVAYQVPGDEDRWFYTGNNQPVHIKAKPTSSTSNPQGGGRKRMSIEADMAAAKSFPAYERGVVVLNFTELNNIDLNDIGSAIIKTRVSSSSAENGSDYQKIASTSSIRISCDYINNRLIIKGLANGLPYDFKIDFDGVDVEIKNVVASGVQIIPTVN